MARPRKQSTDNWMPPGVRFNGYSYILRSTLTGGKQVRLCSQSATRAQVWAVYETYTTRPDYSLATLCSEYLNSPQFFALRPNTQKQYRSCRDGLANITFNQGNKLLDLPPNKITSGILQQILDMRIAEGAAVMGNRQIKGFLSAVYAWALARDRVPGMQSNPCHGVKRNAEIKNKHYVQDWELALAQQLAPRWVARVMELSYLLYGRITEALMLERKHILPEGVYVGRLKGSSDNIIKWSPRLRAVVDECLNTKIISHTRLLTNPRGKPVTYAMLKKPWAKTMRQCAETNPAFVPFTRHHLKHKGCTDQELDQNSAGHKTAAMRQHYRQKPEKVEPAR